MIDRTLPALPWSDVRSLTNRGECLALCLLARYSAGTIPARPLLSFQRAYAMSSLRRFPAVDGGRPGYVVSIWDSDTDPRITIAIEGMRTTSQIWAAFRGFNTSVWPSSDQRVYHSFLTHANTIFAELMADTLFLTTLSRGTCKLTFTGFSLGAAVAEVLSRKFQVSDPAKERQLSKWASPRVGDYGWSTHRLLPADRCSFYFHADPIDIFPFATMANLEFDWFVAQQVYTLFSRNTPYYRFALDGSQEGRFNEDTAVRHTGATIAMRFTLTPDALWYWHSYNAYRMLMWNESRLSHESGKDAFYRFRFLEFDDDNGWQVNQTEGARDYAGLSELRVTPPADYLVPYEPEFNDPAQTLAGRAHTRQIPVDGSGGNWNLDPLPPGFWRFRRARNF